MFGASPDEVAQSMGVIDAGNLTYGDHSTIFENLQTALQAGRYPGEVGTNSLMEDALQKRADDITQMTGMKAEVYSPASDLSQAQSVLDNIDANLGGDTSKMRADIAQEIAQEKQFDQLRAQGYKIPTREDLLANVRQQIQDIQSQAADVAERSPNWLGGVARFIGGMGSGLTIQNPLLLGSTIIPGGEFSSIGARLGWSGLQNGMVSLAGDYAFGKSSAEKAGINLTNADILKNAGYAAALGIAAGGIHEAGSAIAGHYFPPKTTAQSVDIAENLSKMAEKNTPEGNLAANLTEAKTPADVVQAAAQVPTSVMSDTLAAADHAPTTGVRAVLQGAEKEIVAENTQPPGMSWDEHIRRTQAVSDAIDESRPSPNLAPTQSAYTPMDGVLNAMRKENGLASEPSEATLPKELSGARANYGYQDKQFQVKFESDIDRALYITAQKKVSARDDDYRAFLTNQGYTQDEIEKLGAGIRNQIKSIAKDAKPGVINIPRSSPAPKTQAAVAPKATPARRPVSLLKFLSDHGGLDDEGGELAAMDADKWHLEKPFRRKLVNENGMSLDDAARVAQEHGYFPLHGNDVRPDINDLLESVRTELSGKNIYPDNEDVGGISQADIHREIEQFMYENNLDFSKHTNEEIKQAIANAQPSQAAPLQEAAAEGDQPIGIREEADIERELKELEDGVAKVQEIKAHPDMTPSLDDDLEQAIINKFGKYDPDAVVPLGPMTPDENGHLLAPTMKLGDLIEEIKSAHEVLQAMTTCMRR